MCSKQMGEDLPGGCLFNIQKSGKLNQLGLEICIEILWSNFTKPTSLEVKEINIVEWKCFKPSQVLSSCTIILLFLYNILHNVRLWGI